MGGKWFKGAEQQVDSALPTEFMKDRKAEIFHGGHTMVGGFVGPIFWPETTCKTAGMREGYTAMDTDAW